MDNQLHVGDVLYAVIFNPAFDRVRIDRAKILFIHSAVAPYPIFELERLGTWTMQMCAHTLDEAKKILERECNAYVEELELKAFKVKIKVAKELEGLK